MGAVFKQCAVSAVVAMLLLAGCLEKTKTTVTDESKTARAPAGPPEPVTGKTAFWLMYTPARHWSTDILILRLTPKEVPGFKNEGGKAAMWEAMFASPSLHQYRVYSYSIASSPPDIFKGVSAGLRVPWNGVTRDAMPVELTDFNADSDAAYQAAAADAAAWLKKNPDKPLTALALGNTFRFHAPVWYLMWGDKKSGYVAYVDANTGKVLKQK
jgi:hypothetical protein